MSEEDSAVSQVASTTDYKPSFVIIIIDTHPSMFVKNEEGKSPFVQCLEACHALADSLILTNDCRSWSRFSIILPNDDSKSNFVNFDDNLLQTAKLLKTTKGLTNEELSDRYMRKAGLDLAAVFQTCKKNFKDLKSPFYKRNIVFISNDPDPVLGDDNRKFTSLNEVKSFESNDIVFQLVTMDHDFDYSKFYNELFSLTKEPFVEEICEDSEGLYEKLASTVVIRFSQRKLRLYPILGDAKRYIKVTKKNYVHSARIFNSNEVNASGEVLKRTREVALETPCEFTVEAPAGKRDFGITLGAAERVQLMQNTLPIGYTLLYVCDRLSEVGYVLSDASILEKDPKEDLEFFDQFWQYCHDNGKVLVCVGCLKQNDKIRYYEMIPKLGNHKRVFLVKHIPFNCECLPPEETKNAKEGDVPSKQLDVAGKLVEALTFSYDPKSFIDVPYVKQKAYIKSQLLDEPMEEVVDFTADLGSIDKEIEEIIPDFLGFMGGNDKTGSKRKKETAPKPRTTKKKTT